MARPLSTWRVVTWVSILRILLRTAKGWLLRISPRLELGHTVHRRRRGSRIVVVVAITVNDDTLVYNRPLECVILRCNAFLATIAVAQVGGDTGAFLDARTPEGIGNASTGVAFAFLVGSRRWRWVVLCLRVGVFRLHRSRFRRG